ncbi:NB-ARC domain-containing protein [Actinoplanes sp. NPDC020271]|uniref:phosphorylase family protein n=1 Tax=Actinoplanes sp. NPDC020271 TaxID=3363896 RepID=UPI00379E167A
MSNQDGAQVVVLTALPLEYDAVSKHLHDRVACRHPVGTQFEVGSLAAGGRVAVAELGPGNFGAALVAGHAVEMFHPRAILFVGIAGALHVDFQLGDVVVATKVYSFQGGMATDDDFLARPQAYDGDWVLVQSARAVARARRAETDSIPVYFEPVAAGEVVLNSRTQPLAEQLKRSYNDAAAIEMESAGMARAGHMYRTPTLTVRGISDRADGTNETVDAAGSQLLAAQNAANFAMAVITDFLASTPSSPAQRGAADRAERQPTIHSASWPATVPRLPASYVVRDAPIEEAVRLLELRSPAALVGMGGAGKTTCAAAVAARLWQGGWVPDGVLWITCGRDATAAQVQRRLAAAAGSDAQFGGDVEVGKIVLERLLEGRDCLIVLDDVWRMEQLRAVPRLGAPVRMFMTTRNDAVARDADVPAVTVAELALDAARALLAGCVGIEVGDLPARADAICVESGSLALALAMIGARVRAEGGGSEWGDAWQDALDVLRLADPAAIAADLRDYEHPTLFRAFLVGIDALTPSARSRYLELAVFDGQGAAPISAALSLWEGSGLRLHQVRSLLRELADRSLLRRTENGAFQLHDLQSDVARHLLAAAPAGVAAAHTSLVEGYRTRLQVPPPAAGGFAGWADTREPELSRSAEESLIIRDGYLLDHLAHHLLAAGASEEARELLLSGGWLELGLRERQLTDVLADTLRSDDPAVRKLGQALQLSLHVLEHEPEQLAGQLAGRLSVAADPDVAGLLATLIARHVGPWFWPRRPSLPAPGGPLRSTLIHESPVLALALGADDRLVTGTGSGLVRVWDLASGTLVHRLPGHRSAVDRVRVSRDGSRFVSRSDDAIRVWNIHSGRLERAVEPEQALNMMAAAISASGRLVAVGDRQRVLVYRVDDDASATAIDQSWVTGVSFTADDRRIVLCSTHGEARVWDVESGHVVAGPLEHPATLMTHTLTPDGRWLFTGCVDGSIRRWDLTGDQAPLICKGHRAAVNSLTVHPEGELMVSVDQEGGCLVWATQDGTLVRSLAGHDDAVVALSVAGACCLTGSTDHTAKLWDLLSGNLRAQLHAHTGRLSGAALTADGNLGVTAAWDRTARVWDTSHGYDSEVSAVHEGAVTEVVLLPGGTGLSCGDDGRLVTWGADDGPTGTMQLPDRGTVREIVTDANGRALIRGDGDLIHIWDFVTGDLQPLQAPRSGSFPREVTCLAVTGDGRRGFAGHMDGTLIEWDLDQKQLVRELGKHGMWVSSAAVFGQQLITASWDKTIRIWDLGSGQLEQELEGHPARVDLALALSGMRSRVVAACADGSLVAWDPVSGRCDGVINAHAGAIVGVAALHAGGVATIGWDRHLRLWDLENCTLDREFVLDERPDVIAIAGDIILVGTEQGTLSAWRGEEADPIARWTAAAAITALTAIADRDGSVSVMAGDASGAVHQMQLRI